MAIRGGQAYKVAMAYVRPILISAALTAGAACSRPDSPEQQVRTTIEQMERAAEQRNIGDEATRRAIVAEAGLPDDLHARAVAPDIAARYAAYTQQAMDAGVFGAPSYVVEGEIFWGQDRLEFLARRLHAD